MAFMFTLLAGGIGGGSLALQPRIAHAQGINVPIGTTFDFNSIMKYLKDFVLDKLAYLVAKQILHQMTISVVNWINSGFQGNPAFINNPAGFFEDAADQVTANFLVGPLQGLCSPFSLDIRLALATQMTNSSQGRYTCTLSKVIQAQQQTIARAQNGTLVNVTAQNSANGATLNDFMNGGVLSNSNQLSVNGYSANGVYGGLTNNFAQDGGWAGWIALTSEPQNNIYGAYLMAQSDLAQQIASKKAAVDADLNRGNGFLSWQDCKTVSGAQAQAAANASGNTRAAQQLKNAQTNNSISNIGSNPATNALGLSGNLNTAPTQNLKMGDGTTIQTSVDSSGNLAYQDCQTQTPGSVIAGLTNKAVQSPIVEAELANDINSILNALVSQMVSTVLTKGLGGLSSNGSGKGGQGSYTQSVINDIQNQNNGIASKANKQVKDQLISSSDGLKTYKGIYDQAIQAVAIPKDELLAAKTCFTSKLASTTGLTLAQINYGNNQIASITAKLTKVDTLLAGLLDKEKAAQDELDQLANATTTALDFSIDDSTEATQALIDQISSQVDQAKNVTNTSISANTTVAKGTAQANKDLTDAQKKADGFSKDADDYQSLCNGFPANAGF